MVSPSRCLPGSRATSGVEIDGDPVLEPAEPRRVEAGLGDDERVRLKDLADVVELIKTVGLSAEFADELNPYVRDKYLELWRGIQDSPAGPVEAWPR